MEKTFKNIIREILAILFRLSGIFFLIREIFCKNRVTIVFYHNPEPKIFKRHIEYLSRRYNFISLNRAVKAIRRKDWSDIPPKSLVITIDDGHKGNFDLLPVFKEFKVIPTIYICSQIVGTYRHFWFESGDQRSMPELMKCPNQEMLKRLERQSGFQPTKEYPKEQRHALSREEIDLMRNYVDFQVHTRFHPILTKCSQNECEEEIADAKKEVEEMIGRKCKYFPYPRGAYSDREIELVKKAKYASARTCDVGWNDAKTNPYKLKTIAVPDDASIHKDTTIS
ncbi:polysaccharide deacetylase family protein [Planctomycetota bacterium]